jgi:hypothetical protein
MEAPMRARNVTAMIAIAILAVSAKLFLFPPMNAEAISTQAGLNILQMLKDKDMRKIPVQEMHDMSLVFDRNN